MSVFDEIRPLKVIALGPNREFVDLLVAIHGYDEVAAERCWHETVELFLNDASDVRNVPRKHRRAWAEDWAMWTMWGPAKPPLSYCTRCKRERERS